MVSIDRWALCRGAIVLIYWFLDLSRVVSIDRWSFYTGGPSIQVVFWTGFTALSDLAPALECNVDDSPLVH